MRRIRFLAGTFAVVFVLALLMGIAVPQRKAQAGDFPNWRSGSTADNFVDYFNEGGIWYLVTLRPKNNKPGHVYAAGASDGVKRVVIPATFRHSSQDYIVLGLNDYAYEGNSEITSVEIKKGVKFVGSYAFNNCSSLKTVKLADSVNEMGMGTFMGCTKLKKINIPAGLKEMPEAMFDGCTALAKINIGKNVTKIGKGAFLNCTALKKVKFNAGLKQIGNQAFSLCRALEDVKLPASVTKIGEEAFHHCDSFKNLVLPKKVKTIERESFSWCENLASVKLPANVSAIDSAAFMYCSKLEKVEGTNKKLAKIGDSAFSYCEALNQIETGAVTEIGDSAFYKTAVKQVNLSKLVKLGKSSFAYSGLEEVTIPGTVKVICESAFEMCKELEKAILEDGVERLENAAFTNCSRMTFFRYPESLKYLTYSSLERSAWLEIELGKEITYNNVGDISYQHTGNSHYPDSFSINGVCIYMNNMEYYTNDLGYEASRYKEVIEFPAGSRIVSVYLGTGNDCTKVVVPAGCEELDGLINCQGHRVNSDFTPVDLVLPQSLKKLTAILKGEGLIKVNLPKNLEVLGSSENNSKWFVFGGAESLESVHFDGNKVKYIGCGVFSNTPKLTQIYLPEGIEEIGDNAFMNSAIKKVILPATLKKIGNSAFQGTKLTTVDLPEGLTEIGSNAFFDAPLNLATSPNKTKLGDGSCNLPDSIRKIGISAFGNTELTKFVLPNKYEIDCEITNNRKAVMYVKKGSKADKALKEFLKSYTDLWTVKRK